MPMQEETVVIEPVAVRRKTAARMLDCSESTVWKLQKSGALDVIKVRGDDRITVESIKRLSTKPEFRRAA
jgi:hypothetical protein